MRSSLNQNELALFEMGCQFQRILKRGRNVPSSVHQQGGYLGVEFLTKGVAKIELPDRAARSVESVDWPKHAERWIGV